MGDALSCFITDDRHRVQTLRFVVGETAEAVRRVLLQDLRDNPHHVAIEVRNADELLFVVRREELPGLAANEA